MGILIVAMLANVMGLLAGLLCAYLLGWEPPF